MTVARRSVAEPLLAVLRELAQDSALGLDPDRITLDTRLETDLGLDSLGRTELIARLEQALGVRLPDEAVLAATGRDLLALAELARPTADSTSIAEAEAGAGLEDGIQADAAAESASASAASGFAPDLAPNRVRHSDAGTLAQATTLPEVLDWHLERHPERTHILLYGSDDAVRPISYARLAQGAAAVAAQLQAAGLTSGGAVALMLPTGSDYFFGFFGILHAGGIPVPIYPPARPEQLEDHLRRHAGILDNAGAQILITVPEARTVARLLRTWVPSLRTVLTLAAGPDSGQVPAAGRARSCADSVALLQYTSGSTGQPKGVILSHADLLANIRAMGAAVAVRPDDCFVSWLPLYHDMGLIGAWLGSLYFGVPLVSLSPLAFLARPRRWLQAIHDHRGTLSAAPNFAYELCLKRIRDDELTALDLSCWRRALNGAEPVSADTLARFATRFAACGLRAEAMAPVYGLAEAAVGLTFPPPQRGPRIDCIDRYHLGRAGRARPLACDDADAMQMVSCGSPLPGYRLRVVDQHGHALPERTEGRLLFQGPSATRGYYRNAEATSKLLRDGWHDTGDRAYLADGELYLTGRVKDMIIRGGRNLYPYELEQAVGNLPGVRKGCVVAFAATDPRHGSERLILVAETREREPARRETLQHTVRERATDILGLPPDEIVLAPPRAIPKTSSGKLRRGSTRERWLAGQLASAPAPPAWQFLRVAAAGLAARAGGWIRGLPSRLYAGYAWGVFLLLAPGVWLGILLLPRPAWVWALIRAGIRLLRALTLVPLEVSGRAHLPAPGASFVVAANHQSYLDAMALAEALAQPIAFVAKRELATRPLLRLPLQRLGTVFVERFDLLRSAADAGRFEAALQQTRVLGFFPEGTFREQPGLLPFRMGAFLAAANAGVPVLPVAIRGTRELMCGSRFFPRPGRASVIIGPPLQPRGRDWKAAIDLRDRTRAFIEAASGEPPSTR
ncbi:AMP-binding protein [Thiohalocapsa marina]|uniref:AMP-binding protein n=1 Tax=Thiohalocapsa marina TaxID=424902 RepID=A0A5M8FNY3_9GAMM|nr:AMP-binding protein [Thiohalocapsa marina]KAA6186633.1 AMP-binding protein [Thiohalocapsa marina]